MIKYIGSKRVLLPLIRAAFSALPAGSRVLDLFSGTARVGHALKADGFEVHANDHNAYAHANARCYVAADRDAVEAPARALLAELSAVPPRPGWFTETYAERSRYLHPDNAARIEAMREAIAARPLPPDLQAVALVSLMEAADRVDSTVGLQMAYLKQWAKRALNPVELRMPEVLAGPGSASRLDALDAARRFTGRAAYLDPPYNQHSYLGNYHLWETLILWDRPDVYGIACKRVDCRTRKSPFNRKHAIAPALAAAIDALDVEVVAVSFSDEGYLDAGQLEAMLASRGAVAVLDRPHPRYVGAKIGIYNPDGEKVGKVGHLHNRERLFLAGPEPLVAAMRRSAGSEG